MDCSGLKCQVLKIHTSTEAEAPLSLIVMDLMCTTSTHRLIYEDYQTYAIIQQLKRFHTDAVRSILSLIILLGSEIPIPFDTKPKQPMPVVVEMAYVLRSTIRFSFKRKSSSAPQRAGQRVFVSPRGSADMWAI